jgi:hypothetical protein
MTFSSEDRLNAAVCSLEADRLLHDVRAGTNAFRYSLMCEMGFDILPDESIPSENWERRFTGQNPERAIALAAAGDPIAHDALCAVAAHINQHGRVVPSKLQGYIISAARGGVVKRRGRHPVKNLYRDDAIFRAVNIVIGMGIPATRNDDGKRTESACSIVAAALKKCGICMKEGGVVSIWEKRGKARRAGGFDVPKIIRPRVLR